MFLTFNFTCENKNRSIFCKAQLFPSFIKMRVSEQDLVLSDCFPECPCLYVKQAPECHKRDVTGNCWKEVANKAGLENDKIVFVFFQTLYFHADCFG